jgi:hypothetical protein
MSSHRSDGLLISLTAGHPLVQPVYMPWGKCLWFKQMTLAASWNAHFR